MKSEWTDKQKEALVILEKTEAIIFWLNRNPDKYLQDAKACLIGYNKVKDMWDAGELGDNRGIKDWIKSCEDLEYWIADKETKVCSNHVNN